MKTQNFIYSIGLGALWGLLSSGCGKSVNDTARFETDTMRVVGVEPRHANAYTIAVSDRYGNVYTGPCANSTYLYPQRGDTVIATRQSLTNTMICIEKNLTSERLVREFTTRQK